MAIVEVEKEALWLKGLVDGLGFKQDIARLQSDNQNAIFLVKNQVFHARSNI